MFPSRYLSHCSRHSPLVLRRRTGRPARSKVCMCPYILDCCSACSRPSSVHRWPCPRVHRPYKCPRSRLRLAMRTRRHSNRKPRRAGNNWCNCPCTLSPPSNQHGHYRGRGTHSEPSMGRKYRDRRFLHRRRQRSARPRRETAEPNEACVGREGTEIERKTRRKHERRPGEVAREFCLGLVWIFCFSGEGFLVIWVEGAVLSVFAEERS
mmetsp:Transcript_15303/g.38982  ORF Transcript_15303/g.38982 Transcript_15303/m.38982 type:complete len:209 (-) Transcript_15303:14-640(-)